ncbi:uncharacterized protein EI90DRAFT_2915260, partial [Cantharellus anzutake]|uniref:uncharacterized protein n=1 Tax=Cantharellus anzutake TaxID=1750568 RepID=UPI00190491BF
SQGQTIWHVIIDLAPPPTGGLTPFNTYVALSQSSGRCRRDNRPRAEPARIPVHTFRKPL